MNTLITVLVLGAACCMLPACNKQGSGTEEQSATTASTLEYRTRSQELVQENELLRESTNLSKLQRAEVDDAQLDKSSAVVIKAVHGSPFTYDEQNSELVLTENTEIKAPLKGAAVVLSRKAQEKSIALDSDEFYDLAVKYLAELPELLKAQHEERQHADQIASIGRYGESTEGKAIPKLDPAKEVVGEWKSLREVNFQTNTQVNHTANYHQLLDIKSDGNLKWVYYRNGAEFSNETFSWSFNKSNGELTLSYPGGAVFQVLKVFTTQFEPGVIYIETPEMEMLRVFGPAKDS